MKIVNVCLCGPYNIGWGYQENILSKYQKRLGHDVTIIASSFINDKNSTKLIEINNPVEYDEDIKIIRLKNKPIKRISKIIRTYRGLCKALEEEKPDLIFCHGCQFIDAYVVSRYAKNHPNTRLKFDNHADATNTALDVFGKIINKTLWKMCAQKMCKYSEVCYGVLPARCDFLHDMYGIPSEKIELLVMGADDEKVLKSRNNRQTTRKRLGLNDNDFAIITGGKIDIYKKGILNLMRYINNQENENLKLIIFGSVANELKKEFDSLIGSSNYIGWIDQDGMYDLICAADLAIYPGRHSVIWEQTVGCGIPSIFLDLPNTHHVDVNGNCLFLENDTEEEIKNKLLYVINNSDIWNEIKYKSEMASQTFSYKEIAKRSIEKTIASNKI